MCREFCADVKVAMAEVVSSFVVGEALDGRVLLVANEREGGGHME